MATFIGVSKDCFAYVLVLVAALGWGVTRPFLEPKSEMLIKAIIPVWILLDTVRICVMSFRRSNSIPLSFVLLCVLPASIVHVLVVAWIFDELQALIKTLRERRQAAKLRLYLKLQAVLITGVVLAVIAFLLQTADLIMMPPGGWKYEWLLTDCSQNVVFALVLVAIMLLWVPHQHSGRISIELQDELAASLDADAEADAEADKDTSGSAPSGPVDHIGKLRDGQSARELAPATW